MSIRFAAVAAVLGFLAVVASPPPAGAQEGKTVELANGLKYTDTKLGTGEEAKPGFIVSVHYTGWLWKNGVKGAQFDSSRTSGKPITFKLGAHEVIAGWEQGISGMKIGGQRTLIIPPDLAYGAKSPSPLIPPNSTLYFEVELVSTR
jgi:FKBP-type peptidyl-prolyl cis-trans isomerase